jgi:hypothetical protein
MFISRSGRRMPIPTRAAYWAPTRRLAREETNQTRLMGARNYFGKVFLRVVPQVRRCPEHPNQYGALLGHAFSVRVPEVIDVMDLWTDIRRFVAAWRPRRLRPEAAQQAAERILGEWERLSGAPANTRG